jgi:hypothetical protein
MKLNDIQRVAVAAALEKQLKKVLDSRAVDSPRAKVDDDLREAFERDGVDRRRIIVNAREVGTLSLSMIKPRHGVEMRVDSTARLADWVRDTDEGRDALMMAIGDVRVQDALVSAATEYGFLPDGCRMVQVDEPARIKGTVLRVKPEKVAEALAGELPQTVAGLLGGEN